MSGFFVAVQRLVRRWWAMALYLCAVAGWIALCCHDASYGMFWPALAIASLPAALFSAPWPPNAELSGQASRESEVTNVQTR